MIDRDRGKAASLLPSLARLAPIVELRTPLLRQVRREVLNTLPVLVRLSAHQREWIRDPETWLPDLGLRPHDLLLSLVEHLLTKYSLPRFCGNAWFVDGPLLHIERQWYGHLGGGGSLRDFPGWIPKVSRRASHEFLSAPDHFGMREALRFGQAQAIMKDRDLSIAIARSRIGLDFHHDGLWMPLFGMWANSRRDHDEFFLVADYLWAKANEGGSPGIRISGRGFPDLVRSANRFFENLRGAFLPGDLAVREGFDPGSSDRGRLLERRFRRWDSLEGVEPYHSETSGWRYEIREINHPADLIAEGQDMAHCAGGYGWRCRSGRSSIFSLTSRELAGGLPDREVTIEVARSSRRLEQARAWSNRLPHPVARRVILDWCRKNEIDPGVLQG